MLERKLRALGYPRWQSFDPHSDEEFRVLVVWLEDTKIRWLPAEARGALRTFDDQWGKVCVSYLSEVGCTRPFKETMTHEERLDVVDWLLTRAISLEYHDNAGLYNALAQQDDSSDQKARDVLRRLDCTTPEFHGQLRELARLLRLPDFPDKGVLLQTVANILQQKFSSEALQAALDEAKKKEEAGKGTRVLDPKQFPLGFTTGDPVLDRAATVLRLLYIQDIRELQTKINEIIVSAQALTANPKCDASLGRVGK